MKIQPFYHSILIFLFHVRSAILSDLKLKTKCLEMDYRLSDIICWRMTNGYYTQDTEMNAIKSDVISVAKSTRHYITSNTTNTQDNVYIYVHAFNKADSMKGILVLDQILTYMYTSGLIMDATRFFLVLHGNFISYEDYIPKNVIVIKDFIDYGHFFEFTTLSLMQLHSQYMHPEAKILYLHTKGSSRGTNDALRTYWLHMMCIYNIHYYHQNIQLLNNGWDASGILYMIHPINIHPPPIYAGNFFWVKAKKVFQNLDVLELNWHYRFGAEYWLLADDSSFWPLYHRIGSPHEYQNKQSLSPTTKCNLSFIYQPLTKKSSEPFWNGTPLVALYPLYEIPNVKDVKPLCETDNNILIGFDL